MHSRSSFSTGRRSRAERVAAVGTLAFLLLASPAAARQVLIGHSAQGRPIAATRLGDPASPRKALVVGSIHGDEPGGLRVTRALRRMNVTGVDLWLVNSVNPDGLAQHRRLNARGADLNRDFGAFSQPESRAVRRLVLRLRPAVSIWYHQPWGAVLTPACGRAPAIERRYARRTRMRLSCRGHELRGTATKWERGTIRGASAFVVELAPGPVTPATALLQAHAALAAARGR